nr:MAG TPA: hypothetical protein [Caudoviricetes sp.]
MLDYITDVIKNIIPLFPFKGLLPTTWLYWVVTPLVVGLSSYIIM